MQRVVWCWHSSLYRAGKALQRNVWCTLNEYGSAGKTHAMGVVNGPPKSGGLKALHTYIPTLSPL